MNSRILENGLTGGNARLRVVLPVYDMIHPARFVFALVCCALAGAAQVPSYAGTLVLAGGEVDDNNTAVYGTMVQAAGSRNAVIAIVTAASDDGCCDPDSSWVLYNTIFATYSPASIFWVPIDVNHTHNNANATILKQLESATLVFFSGGDQTRVIASFYNDDHVVSPALQLIREKFFSTQPGFAVGGSSAGTACQPATVMIADGLSYSALVNGSIPNHSDGEDNLLYDPEGGIGLFPYLLDSHHAERGRQGRFIRLLSDTVRQPNGSTIGLGIDQNTSAIYTPSSPIVVISGGAAGAGAWHYDVSGARAVRSSKGWSVSNVVVSYATNGDSLNLRTGQVFPAAWKTPLAGNEQRSNVFESGDVFNSPYAIPPATELQFKAAATLLFDTKGHTTSTSSTWEHSPMFCVTFDRNFPDAVGWKGSFEGTEFISFQHLRVAIAPC